MNYSQVSISNLALNRIGARGAIVSINENTPNAKKVLLVWDAIFQEVLAERDWKFAKTRAQLQLSTTVPLYAYKYAWVLPSDLLRFVRPVRRTIGGGNNGYGNYLYWGWGVYPGWYHRDDWPFHPYVYYKVEAVQTGTGDDGSPTYTQCALTDYGGQCGAPKINYIRLITDMTQLMPGFVNCLAYRLAAELAVGVTEDKAKAQSAMQMYRDTLNSAEAQNESMDYNQDEAGSETWLNAGRFVGQRW